VWHWIRQSRGLLFSISQTRSRHRRMPISADSSFHPRGQLRANLDEDLEAIWEIAGVEPQICKSCRLIEIEKVRMKSMAWQMRQNARESQYPNWSQRILTWFLFRIELRFIDSHISNDKNHWFIVEGRMNSTTDQLNKPENEEWLKLCLLVLITHAKRKFPQNSLVLFITSEASRLQYLFDLALQWKLATEIGIRTSIDVCALKSSCKSSSIPCQCPSRSCGWSAHDRGRESPIHPNLDSNVPLTRVVPCDRSVLLPYTARIFWKYIWSFAPVRSDRSWEADFDHPSGNWDRVFASQSP
jgi:hypothetical protein